MQANKTKPTRWRNKRRKHSPVAGSADFWLCAQQKHKPHLSPHYRGVGQEHWQSLSYLPSAARAGSDKIRANE